MKRKPPSLDKPYPRHRRLSADEEALWRKAMGEKAEASVQTDERHVEQSETSREIPRSTQDDVKPAPRRGKEPPHPTHLDKPTHSRIRRGAVAIEATLDLHGHTRISAYSALQYFIAVAQASGVKLALIITGKGRKGAGTLREELPRWLNESPLREAIIAYDRAGPRHGGEGAFYVRIRKQK